MNIKPTLKKYGLLLLLLLVLSCQSAFGEESSRGRLDDYELVEEDLREVFRDLAKAGEINLLMDQTVKGTVTFKFREGLTPQKAIELLAGTFGYTCNWLSPQRVAVGSKNILERMQVEEIKTYHLTHVDAEELTKALKGILEAGRVGIDQADQVTIRASLLEHQNVEEVIWRLDRLTPMYVMEVKMVELSADALRKLGINQTDQGSVDWLVASDPVAVLGLKELTEGKEIRLLGGAIISTHEGREGKVFIGDQYPMIFTRITEKGVEEVIDYQKIGVNLRILPRSSKEGNTDLSIRAEVSSIIDWRRSSGGNDLPVLNTREVGFIRRLQEGEVCILSGINLIQARPTSLSKLPLLSKILNREEGLGEQSAICILLPSPSISIDEGLQEEVGEGRSILGSTLDPGTIEEKKAEKTTGGGFFEPEVVTLFPGVETGAKPPPTTMEGSVTPPVDDGIKKESLSADPEKETSEVSLDPLPDLEITIEDRSPTVTPQLEQAPPAPIEKESKKTPSEEPSREREAPGLMIRYTVKKGDTVFALGRKYGISPESILRENGLSTSSMLTIGQNLSLPIPFGHLYQVKAGETLWRIAKEHNLDVELLKEINEISDVTVLKTGQIIILPVPVKQEVSIE